MSTNPLAALLSNGTLSELDFAVIAHGFLPHGRDYRFLVQDSLCKDPGTYELVFTHIVDLKYETRVVDRVWQTSWDDVFTNYAKWLESGQPEGYVFGTDWSLAYPGIAALPYSAETGRWSERLGHSMHAAAIETDRFSMTFVYGDVRHHKVSDDVGPSQQVFLPLSTFPHSSEGS